MATLRRPFKFAAASVIVAGSLAFAAGPLTNAVENGPHPSTTVAMKVNGSGSHVQTQTPPSKDSTTISKDATGSYTVS